MGEREHVHQKGTVRVKMTKGGRGSPGVGMAFSLKETKTITVTI